MNLKFYEMKGFNEFYLKFVNFLKKNFEIFSSCFVPLAYRRAPYPTYFSPLWTHRHHDRRDPIDRLYTGVMVRGGISQALPLQVSLIAL